MLEKHLQAWRTIGDVKMCQYSLCNPEYRNKVVSHLKEKNNWNSLLWINSVLKKPNGIDPYGWSCVGWKIFHFWESTLKYKIE